MSDGTGDLDELLARLDAEGHPMEAHPASERLSAFQEREFPPEELAAVQAHLETCSFCRERLNDLAGFLAYISEEPGAKDVADFVTTTEWRRLREKLAPQPIRGRQFLAKSGFAVAALLSLALGWAAYYIGELERELATPVTDVQTTTLESSGSRRGAPGTSEVQSFRLGDVAVFETHSEHPYRRYRLIFRDETARIRKSVEDTEEDGLITLFLPRRFLAPGLYHIEVVGLDGASVHSVRDFDVRIYR